MSNETGGFGKSWIVRRVCGEGEEWTIYRIARGAGFIVVSVFLLWLTIVLFWRHFADD